jgi:hypothetical protein
MLSGLEILFQSVGRRDAPLVPTHTPIEPVDQSRESLSAAPTRALCRAGWKLFWRLKSRSGRPPIPARIQALLRRIASANPLWGEERIANEHHSPRMPGLADSTVRIASTVHPEVMGPPLQRRTPTYGTGSRCARSPSRPPHPSKSQSTPSPGRIVFGPCQIDPRRIASRILPRAFLCVTELRTTGTVLPM